ncbi:MAG: PHP domain-containing protein, partial [Vicinamibacteria bacterium]
SEGSEPSEERGEHYFRMRARMAAMLLLAAPACQPEGAPVETGAPPTWWKGNLHTHSLWSDGDDFPEMVVDWYRKSGYDFVALSDHNVLAQGEKYVEVEPAILGDYRNRFGEDWVEVKEDGVQVRLKTLEEYRKLFEEPGEFLLIQSEEITDRFETKPLHVNATNIQELIEPQGGGSVREVLQRNVDAVLAQRERTGAPMFPHVNHPNFGWAVKVEDLIGLRGEKFFEVYNGHPLVHNEGDALRPSTERMWDILLAEKLSAGESVVFGIAVDDAHNYRALDSQHSNPGRGWVVVRARYLSPESIIEAMERGDFYGSSGVELEEITASEEALSLSIRAEEGVSYRTEFVGTRKGYDRATEEVTVKAQEDAAVLRRYSDDIGEVLSEVEGPEPSYRFAGDEIYVRAKVVSTRLKENPYRAGEYESAWVQPVVPDR